jgi:disulfide bond formation protein DsbB
MMLMPAARPAPLTPALRLGAVALMAAAAAILGALAFEHMGGYAPCPLCLQQRYAYYAGIPLIALALALLWIERPMPAGVLLGLAALAFVANAGLAGYHTGVEWKLWAGPDTCAAGTPEPLNPGPGGLLEALKSVRVVRCDEPALHVLGLSLAAWNVLACLLIAAVTGAAALAAARAPSRPA